MKRQAAARVLISLAGLALVAGGCALASGESIAGPDSRPADEPSGAGAEADPFEASAFPAPGDDDENPHWFEALVKNENGEAVAFKYRNQRGTNIAEGDIALPDDIGQMMSAVHVGRRWPNGIVPYVIDANLPSASRVVTAIAHWEQKTKLKFVGRTTERDYLHFRSAGGCSSFIGQGGGRQTVQLDTGDGAATVQAIGINRAPTNQRIYYFYKGGYATTGNVKNADALTSHFRYLMAPGKAVAQLVDVAFDVNGHLFAWYDDGTVSEGDHTDFASYAPAQPYALPGGMKPADIAGITVDAQNRVLTYFHDGTFSIGTPTELAGAAPRRPFTVAADKTPADLANVELGSDGKLIAFYNETTPHPDGGAPQVRGIQVGTGAAANALGTAEQALTKIAFMGHCGTGATIHEIGHAIGLYHEQTRHDRDEWVEIQWDNITPANQFNFAKHSRVVGVDHGPYDFGSIMHYGPTAFTKNGKETIVPRDRTPFDGGTYREQRESLSAGDIAAVGAMYGTDE